MSAFLSLLEGCSPKSAQLEGTFCISRTNRADPGGVKGAGVIPGIVGSFLPFWAFPTEAAADGLPVPEMCPRSGHGGLHGRT